MDRLSVRRLLTATTWAAVVPGRAVDEPRKLMSSTPKRVSEALPDRLASGSGKRGERGLQRNGVGAGRAVQAVSEDQPGKLFVIRNRTAST